ncbi:hypothetical protein GQ44DRAFT_769616 [Phaeosphaeriaceae sp. PMI808]|nr:hypothetical protein GQ44DRAFT_769616 [Phaeosphaeriaceae sp. PMI808]
MDKEISYTSVAPAHHGKPMRMKGRVREILIAFAAMTLPMLVFSGLLLGLIFHYRITQNDYVSKDLAFDFNGDQSNAYFVRISATILVTVASWSSTIAPILIGFAVTLISYPVAKNLMKASANTDTEKLPTPFQLSLIIRMISSSPYSAIWSWLTYSLGWRGRRENQANSIKSLSTILILGILLSTLVLATDTWLHFTTKTVIFSQIHKNSDASGLGFGVYQNCTNVETTLMSCNLNNPASGFILLNVDPMRVLSNTSDTMVVPIHPVLNDQYAYIARPPTTRFLSIDYSVSTFAVQSQCTPVTTKCANPNNVAGAGTRFNCPFAFQGTVNTASGAYNSVTNAYFTDSTGSNNDTLTTPISNPYYHAAMILANMRNPRPRGYQNDPQFLEGGHGGATIVAVFCNSTVYEVEYSFINGTIRNWKTSKANRSTTLIVQATQRLTDVGKPNLIQAASVAGLSNVAQDVADQYATAYSQTALSVASGAFEPRSALSSQVREQILVARVPKTPLFVLIVANLLMVVLGLVLTVVALLAVRGDTGEAQSRLSISVLVAAMFEARVRWPAKSAEDMFQERHGERGPRVGFVRTREGGWMFQSWLPN